MSDGKRDSERAREKELELAKIQARTELPGDVQKAGLDALAQELIDYLSDDLDAITSVQRLKQLQSKSDVPIPPPPPVPTMPSPSPPPPPKSRLLVVDDDPTILEELAEILRGEGYIVHTATDARLAVNEVHSMGQCDCVLLDLMMPEYPGWAYMDFVRWTRHAKIPLILITAMQRSDVERLREEIRMLDGESFIFTKPIDIDNLLEVVRLKIAERRSPTTLR